ncbi:uncharacterized protein LOC131026390 [Salvia miltiorrhiza]|uniref:uncharacterized protein LOC131026390 n=1 Tax=Salvia miltiorrhiza TaxID=226208 RepID=UPI0025AB820A|nr:uncharacterized protein LOC131026390 [Salvia miltiorrhiza]
MDWSENNWCIKCDKGGNVLLCSENGCPLAVHEGCLGCPARTDDAGRFYCPYCLYKQAVAESRKAREYALLRKKALLIFMDGSEKDTGENKACEDNGHDQSKTSGYVNDASCDGGKSKSNNDGIIDQPFPLGEEEKICIAEKDYDTTAGSKGEDHSLMMNVENGNRTVEEKQTQKDECEPSVEEKNVQEEEREASVEEVNVEEEEHEASVEEEKIQEEDCETSSDSTNQDPSLTVPARPKRGSKRSKPVDKESEAVPVQSKLLKQHDKKQASPAVTPTRRSARRSSLATETGKVVKEKFPSPRSVRKPDKPSEKPFSKAKRRRLMWTAEEEEALTAAVNRYSNEAKIPWSKILEESKSFDVTRTPADLKDKWKNKMSWK